MGFHLVLGGLHSILGVVLVLALLGPLVPPLPHVRGGLPVQEGQEALHFCGCAADALSG